MLTNQAGSLEDLKAFVSQFELLLPENKRVAIWNAIAQVEQTGGIQNEQQGNYILQELLKALGMQ